MSGTLKTPENIILHSYNSGWKGCVFISKNVTFYWIKNNFLFICQVLIAILKLWSHCCVNLDNSVSQSQQILKLWNDFDEKSGSTAFESENDLDSHLQRWQRGGARNGAKAECLSVWEADLCEALWVGKLNKIKI